MWLIYYSNGLDCEWLSTAALCNYSCWYKKRRAALRHHEYSLSTIFFFLMCFFFHFPRSPFHSLAPGCPGHPFSPTVIEILSHYVILQGASNNYENEVNYVGHIVQRSSNSNTLFAQLFQLIMEELNDVNE